MAKPLSRATKLYFLGLGGVMFSAWLTGVTSSMVPLALGASASILCTVWLVKAIAGGGSMR